MRDSGTLITCETAVVVVRSTWIERSMFDFFVAAVNLAPVGLLLLFWGVFPRDCGIHPIYQESGIETVDDRTEVQETTIGGAR
jgi:hypothetical protein